MGRARDTSLCSLAFDARATKICYPRAHAPIARQPTWRMPNPYDRHPTSSFFWTLSCFISPHFHSSVSTGITPCRRQESLACNGLARPSLPCAGRLGYCIIGRQRQCLERHPGPILRPWSQLRLAVVLRLFKAPRASHTSRTIRLLSAWDSRMRRASGFKVQRFSTRFYR